MPRHCLSLAGRSWPKSVILLALVAGADEIVAADPPKPIRVNLDPYRPRPLPAGLDPSTILRHYTHPDVSSAVSTSKRMEWGPSGKTLHVTQYQPGQGPPGGIGTPASDRSSIAVRAGDLAASGHKIVPNNNPNYAPGKNWLIERQPGQTEIRFPPSVHSGAGYKLPKRPLSGSGGAPGGWGSKISSAMQGIDAVNRISNVAMNTDPEDAAKAEIAAYTGKLVGTLLGEVLGPVGGMAGSYIGEAAGRAAYNPQPPGPSAYLPGETKGDDFSRSQPSSMNNQAPPTITLDEPLPPELPPPGAIAADKPATSRQATEQEPRSSGPSSYLPGEDASSDPFGSRPASRDVGDTPVITHGAPLAPEAGPSTPSGRWLGPLRDPSAMPADFGDDKAFGAQPVDGPKVIMVPAPRTPGEPFAPTSNVGSGASSLPPGRRPPFDLDEYRDRAQHLFDHNYCPKRVRR